jgi:hypothetical protein
MPRKRKGGKRFKKDSTFNPINMSTKLFFGILIAIALVNIVSAVECNYDKQCWDSHNQSCYYTCQDNKCIEFKTDRVLPPYPYCNCWHSGGDWQNQLGNDAQVLYDNCKFCAHLSCLPSYFNETRMECDCGDTNQIITEKIGFFQRILNWFKGLFG